MLFSHRHFFPHTCFNKEQATANRVQDGQSVALPGTRPCALRYKVWPWLRWWKSTTPKWLWRDSHIPALDLLHWAETLLQLKENKSKSPQRMHCIQQKLKLQRSSCWIKNKKLPPWSPKKSPGDSSARSLGRVWINFSPVAPKGKIIKLFHTHYRLISVISVSNQNNPRE